MSDTALVVMARYPELGKTKTRLARSIGDQHTQHLYTAFLSDLAQRFAGHSCDLHWAYTPAEVNYQAFITALVPQRAQQMWSFPQQGADLGARLHHAFHWTRDLGYKKTVVIGSDSPQVSRTIIDRARAALEEAEVVLGPADDGGYYLIAMTHPYDVFSNIPMSTPVVAQMTIATAEQQGLRTHIIDTLFDVDELADLQRLAQQLQADPTLAPVTAAYLATVRNVL